MDNELKKNLTQICLELLNELEKITVNIPYGTCYLLGHCLSEGLRKSGFSTKEVTGHLVLQDKHRKNIVYGTSKSKGKLVGYYHTWCVLNLGEEIIVDPGLKYIKMYLKKFLNIKLNERFPDILISNEDYMWYYQYLEDSSLTLQSKFSLNKLDPNFVNHLISRVVESTNNLFNKEIQPFRKSA